MSKTTTAGGETSRDKRREDRREQLLDVAMHLFSRFGLEGTTTKDIAKAAEVSPGLLYHYYASKEDLLVDVVRRFQALDVFNEIVRKHNNGPVREAFVAILRALGEFFDEHLDEIWLITRAAARFPAVSEALRTFHGEGRTAFVEFFKDRAQKGELVELKNPDRLAGLVCHILVSERLMEAPDRADVESIADTLLGGIMPR